MIALYTHLWRVIPTSLPGVLLTFNNSTATFSIDANILTGTILSVANKIIIDQSDSYVS